MATYSFSNPINNLTTDTNKIFNPRHGAILPEQSLKAYNIKTSKKLCK